MVNPRDVKNGRNPKGSGGSAALGPFLMLFLAAALASVGAVVYRSARPARPAGVQAAVSMGKARDKDPKVVKENFDSGHFAKKEAWHWKPVVKEGGSGGGGLR